MPAALLTAVDATDHVHLIIGSNPLAGARCAKSLEAGARPILLAPPDVNLHYALAQKIDDGKIEWLKRHFCDDDLSRLGRQEVNHVVDAVFVTLAGHNTLRAHISDLCRRLRIPVNVTDAPSLCTFTLLSTHTSGPLQIGVTTSGNGCHLSSRIRREIAASLPATLGPAVERLGAMRRRIQEEDGATGACAGVDAEDEDGSQTSAFNKLITPSDLEAAKTRRMRWLAQICEYWPLRRLAAITEADVAAVLRAYSAAALSNPSTSSTNTTGNAAAAALPPSLTNLSPPDDSPKPRPTIILAGSGPGHPSLLTLATLRAIQTADIVLADKLVPSAVLDLVPRRATTYIARKFPGNADAAQDELLALAHAGLAAGASVLRLKQGDPFLYGRGAEEVAWFRERGWEAVVLPGVTSALAGPLLAGVPVTHRGVSERVVVCTGTGRKGRPTVPEGWGEGKTVVWLMALHRLDALVRELLLGGEGFGEGWERWPAETPCAVVERASCADQRVVRTRLGHVVHAVEECGSRPPGLLVVGRVCEVLHPLEKGTMWTVEEGLGEFGRWSLEVVDGMGMGMGGGGNMEGGVKE